MGAYHPGGSTPLSTVLHSTMTKSRKRLIMASIKSNALMAWAFATGRVQMEDGGHEITNPLTVGRNPNVTSTEYYDTVPMAQTDEFDTVSYNWARVVGSVIISDQEQDENKGEALIFKLLKAKMDVLEESIKEKFNGYLYGAGAGKDPLGLSVLIPDDPTTGVLGNIDRATEVQWRTSAYLYGGQLDQTNIEEAYDDNMMDLSMKGEKPDVSISGRNQFRLYRAAVRDKYSFALSDTANGNRMMDLGFGGVSFNNVPMIYDEDCPIDKSYWINSKYLLLHILRHVNMRVKKLLAPWNQDATGNRTVWQGQWCMWRAFRTHSVIVR